jgi:hypothetical protein
MTIRAPHHAVRCKLPKTASFEREVLFETLGACWALSARNVSGYFSVQLQIDLSRLQLLYGVPCVNLPEAMLLRIMHSFQAQPKADGQAQRDATERNALLLLGDMSEADFLNFSTGFNDAVVQVLQLHPAWGTPCRQAHLALKYYGVNLIEQGLQDERTKRTYAELLYSYLEVTHKVFRQEKRSSHMPI